jgi:signal transduction histidine kinase
MSSTAKTNAALAAAIIFLALSSFAAYFAFARLRTSQQWVQHTRDVQLALHQFATMDTRAARQRAEYIDSGDVTALDRYAQSLTDARNQLSKIQQLTGDNVLQQNSFRKLAQLSEERISAMNRAIELRRAGKSTLETQAPITREIVALGDATDDVLQSMYNAEQALLNERQRREQSSFTVISAILASSLFLALVLFLIHHQLLMEQVRERMQAEASQRAVSARLLTMQDEERRRFARELHDSVGQHLAAMKMAISLLETKLPGDRIVQDCMKLLDNSITETRTISHLLHPPLLDEAGFNSACRWFVEGFATRSGIQVNLDIHETAARLSEPIELVLFRVLQESLTNVHRHSGATSADVSLAAVGNEVILTVRDHGRGMPATILQNFRPDGTGGGVGLAGMTERMREIGGHLDVHSSAQGTEIVARAPVQFRPARPATAPAAQEVSR